MVKLKRIAISALCIFLLLTTVGCQWGNEEGVNMNDLKVNTNKIPLKLWYDEEAPFINEGSEKATMMAGQDIGWQNWSLPLGNGYVGANVFGRTETERIQITEKTLANPWQLPKTVNGSTSYPEVAGLNNFSETYIDFGHKFSDVRNYRRELDLRTAISTTTYTYDEALYSREYFVSYPDNVLVIRLDAQDGPLSFTLRPTIPFEQSYMETKGDGLSKKGTVTSSVQYGIGCIELSGTLA
jgi:alpha-L-fucosidase 2